jgi:hypothetical protein
VNAGASTTKKTRFIFRDIRVIEPNTAAVYGVPLVEVKPVKDVILVAPGIHPKPLTLKEFAREHTVVATSTNEYFDVITILTRDYDKYYEWVFERVDEDGGEEE